MPWPLEQLARQVSPQYLSNFESREKFDLLLDLRSQLKEIINKPELKNLMRNEGDLKSLEFTVITSTPDSEVATLFDLLENDTSAFFFGGTLHI